MVIAASFHAFDPTDRIEASIVSSEPDALLATAAAIPVLRDLVLLQTDWGPEFGRQTWRCTVLDHSPLDADEPAALAFRGGSIRRPDADRIRGLIDALRATAAATEGAERVGVTAMLAWLQCSFGCSSIAGRYAAAALTDDPGHGLASIVRTLVDRSILPEWAYRPNRCFDLIRPARHLAGRPARGRTPRAPPSECRPDWDWNDSREIIFMRHAAEGFRSYACKRQGEPMSASSQRVRRADNTPSVLLQGRVTPQVKGEIELAAAASGVSIAYYLEALINELVAEHGTLPLVSAPSRHNTQQELPITDAA